MSLQALITRIEPHASGYSRTKILTFVQDAIDSLFDDLGPSSQFIPSDNEGFPPYLKTTDTVYQYSVVNANLTSTLQKSINGTNYPIRCRQVLAIFIDVTETEFDDRWSSTPYVFCPISLYSTRMTEKLEVANVPFDFIPPNETDPAAIIFKDNPGTTTDKYFIHFTWEPPRLTAETGPLVINTDYFPAVIDYCIGQIQMLSNGKPNEFQNKFESFWKPKFRAALNGVRGRNNLQVQPVIC